MLLRPLSPPARFLVCFGLTVPCLLITVTCLLTFKDHNRMEEAFDWVRQKLQLENRIHELVLAVHEVDDAQRSYVYTGRLVYLDAYVAAEAKIPKELTLLRHAITDHPQQLLFRNLEDKVSERLNLAREVIELKKASRQDAAVRLSRSESSKDAMQSVDRLARDMHNHEERLLTEQDEILSGRRRSHTRWLYSLLALNISSLGSILLLLRRLEKTQSLARICAWSKRVEHEGQWLSFEDYLSRRFSITNTHTISPGELDHVLTDSNSERQQEEPACNAVH